VEVDEGFLGLGVGRGGIRSFLGLESGRTLYKICDCGVSVGARLTLVIDAYTQLSSRRQPFDNWTSRVGLCPEELGYSHPATKSFSVMQAMSTD